MKPKPFIIALGNLLRGEKVPAMMRLGLGLMLAVWFISGVGSLAEDDAPALEFRVKAAFLVKFATFTDWPHAAVAGAPAAGDITPLPFTIGILGDDPFGTFFDESVKPQRIKGRPIRLLRLREMSELSGCQAVFVAGSESARVAEVLQALDGKPVLTVADVPDFARRGGMIEFTKEDGKVRFEINVAAAEKVGLKMSAKLLQVGIVVVSGHTRG